MPSRRPSGSPDHRRVISRADARALGIPIRELGGPGYVRVFHDRYVPSDVAITPLLRAQIALGLVDPEGFASHHTAAEIWKGWVPEHPLTHVTVADGAPRSRRRGIRCHVTTDPDPDVGMHRGVRTTSPVQTFLDLATHLDLIDLTVLGDSLLKRQLVTPEQLIDAADRYQGRDAVLARRAARLVREGVDSPMETRLRLLIVLAGLPEPVVNFTLFHEDGSWHIRFDLSYPHLKIAIEYDGRQHAESRQQWQHDIVRREDTDRLGWLLIIVLSDGIYTDPGRTLDRVVDALRRQGVAVRIRGDEWRRHFPGRRMAA